MDDLDGILSGETFDSRQLFDRLDELEQSGIEDEDGKFLFEDEDATNEHGRIKAILEEIGDYDEMPYGVTFIRDDYFEDYAQELADDIGAINADAAWPTNYIDWEAAANALKDDYSLVEIEGTEYWYR